MKICFVTNELFPVSSGGIGRMLHDFCTDNLTSDRGHEIFFLVIDTADPFKQARITSYFEETKLAKVRFVDRLSIENARNGIGKIWSESSEDFSRIGFVAKSQLVLHQILAWQEDLREPFDFIEFPDMGGWAYASIGARRSGLAFSKTSIVIRLHSTLGMIYAHEPYWHDNSDALYDLYEVERQCLKDADWIVGHLDSVIVANRNFYGLPESWLAKTRIEFPPITLRETPSKNFPRGRSSPDDIDFLFSGRLQPVKRPDILIKAAVQFVHRNPSHRGLFILAAYGWDHDYVDWLKSLIPLELANQIVILRSPTSRLRDHLQNHSIVVIPSTYESLCLSAYENSLSGTHIILNESCVAFSSDSPWIDGLNCTKFDGTISGLSDSFELALQREAEKTITPVQLPDSEPYWNTHENYSMDSPPQNKAGHLVIVLIVGTDTVGLSKAISKLENCLTNPNISLLLLVDQVTTQGELTANSRCQVLSTTGIYSTLEAVSYAKLNMDADYLVLVDVSKSLLDGDFLTLAKEAMDNDPEVDIVACHSLTSSYNSSDEWQLGDRDVDIAEGFLNVSVGSRWFSRTTETSIVSTAAMWRTGKLVEEQFDEDCPRDMLGIALSKAIAKGANSIVIPIVGAWVFSNSGLFPPDSWLFAGQLRFGHPIQSNRFSGGEN